MSRCKWGRAQWPRLLFMLKIITKFSTLKFKKKVQIKIAVSVTAITFYKAVAVHTVIKMLSNRFQSKRKKVKIIC